MFVICGLIFSLGVVSAATHTCSSCSTCGSQINSATEGDTVYLTQDITDDDGDCIIIDVSDIEFDCQGYTIDGDGDGDGAGIYMHLETSNTIRNCTITGFDEGIFLSSSSLNNITNNTVTNNQKGIYLSDSTLNEVNINWVCNNNESDFNLSGISPWNSGDENTCDIPDGWNDTGTTGCTYPCSGETTTTITTSTTSTSTTSTSTISTTSTSTSTTVTTTTSTTSTTSTSTSTTVTSTTSTSTSTTSTTSTSTTSTTSTSTTTLPDDYCPSYGGSTSYESISDFSYAKNPSNTITITVNIYIANPTGCTYGDPCPEYDSSPEYVNVWIDWNGDKVFDNSEKVIDDALTGYLNINYRGTMVSSHVVSIPDDAVNHTTMRANLGWDYDPNDPCYLYWTWGNVVDKIISIKGIPEIEDINVTGPPGNESYPMTMKDVTLNAIIAEAEGYEVYRIAWWGDVENTEGSLNTHNPHTYVPAVGAHGGDKVAGATISYRNTETGETGSATYSKEFDIFFAKYDNDDGDVEPNWFEYWISDETVPNMTGSRYNSTTNSYGFWNGIVVHIGRRAAGQHYRNPIVVNTFFGAESFGGPTVTGADSVSEVVAHELYHKWVDDQWEAGGIFNGKADTDKNYRPAGVTTRGYVRNYDDQLPDSYENGTSHTNWVNNTDTYNLNDSKARDYQFYGDQEYMAMRTGNGARAEQDKDWANPGKQTPGISDASISTAAIGTANGAGFARGELTGTSADEGNDTDGNSLYENLKFGAELNVTNAGLFTAVAFLIDSSEETITYITTDFTLDSGTQTLVFEFDGVTIREYGVNGPYTVSLEVGDEEGNILDEANYTTTAYNSADFEMSAVGFTGSYSDSGTDTDADGVYNYLTVDVQVNVTEAGTYTVEGWLYDSDGGDIAHASDSRSLGTGIQTMELNFSGTAIANNRVNGPYILKYLRLTDSDEKQLDFIGVAYNTSTYSYTEFRAETGGAKFGNSYNDYGSDTNLDETYDYLVIEVGVNVTDAGNYTFSGILYDSNGADIDSASAESALSGGSQTMLLNFDGDDVYNNAVDGPYTLKYLVLHNNNGTQADYIEVAHTTVAYNYTDFASESLISLDGNYSDQGLDTNNNSLYDYLIIGVGVQISSDGNVIISARLMDGSENEIQWASNTSYLYANQSNTMELEFNGTKIGNNGEDGPYYLKDLYIYHTGDPEKSIYVVDAYTTSAYAYTEFEATEGCDVKGDSNCDGAVSDFELLSYINDWTLDLVGDFDLLAAINTWATLAS